MKNGYQASMLQLDITRSHVQIVLLNMKTLLHSKKQVPRPMEQLLMIDCNDKHAMKRVYQVAAFRYDRFK